MAKRCREAVLPMDHVYRHIVETVADGILYHDAAGLVVSASDAACSIFGRSMDELRYWAVPGAEARATEIAGSTTASQEHPVAVALSSGQVVRDIHLQVFIPLSGDHRWISITTIPLPGKDSEIQACSVVKDITAKKLSAEVIAYDINERVLAESLSKSIDTINTLIHSTLDFDDIMQRVLHEASKALGSETAAVSFRDADGWLVSYSHGFVTNVTGMRMDYEEEPYALAAVASGEPLFIENTSVDHRVNRQRMMEWGIRSVILLPVVVEEERAGLFFFNYHSGTASFQEAHRNFVAKLAASLSLAMENALLFRKLQVELAERSRIEVELICASSELEQRVEQRTLELEANRAELEVQNQHLLAIHHELELSRDRYSSLYDQAPLAYITLDTKGIIREINLTGSRLLGFDRCHLVGHPFVTHVHRHYARLFYGHMVRCRKHSGQVSTELKLRLPDNAPISVLLQSVQVHEPGGEVLFRTAITDISERKQAEDKLVRMNRLYVMLSRTNEAIVRASNQDLLFRETCQICVNNGGFAMAWIGMLDEVSGVVRPVAACGAGTQFLDGVTISVHDEPVGPGIVGSAIRRGGCCIYNDIPDVGNGPPDELAELPALASAAFAIKLNGEPIGALALYATERDFFDLQMVELLQQMGANLSFALDGFERDARQWAAERALQQEISQRLRTMEELREKEQLLMHQSRQAAMGEMISNISHQWRQPLNVLGLVVQELPILYEAGELSKEHLDASVEKAKRLVFHMSQTIEDFRNFFMPNKEKISFRAYDVVTNTIALVDASFREHRITIDVSADEDIYIHGYPNEFSQVLLNILLNAKDALLARRVEKRRVQVWLMREEERAVVTISDNAGGIPDPIISKIFEPYFTTKSPDKGTGLGLFMSKVIIETNMNGRLAVRNTVTGAEFSITV